MKNGLDKIKIYLSKSKSGSMDTLMKVRDVLNRYENIEILEFEGGEYNSDKLMKSDIVLIIPPELPKAFDDKFTVGKGQYTEYDLAFNNSDYLPIFLLVNLNNYEMNVINADFCSVNIVNQNWKTNYAEIRYSPQIIDEFTVALEKDYSIKLISKKDITLENVNTIANKKEIKSLNSKNSYNINLLLLK